MLFNTKLLHKNLHQIRLPTTLSASERKMNGKQPSAHHLIIMFLVMPFGLTNAPAVFQALINALSMTCSTRRTHTTYVTTWKVVCETQQMRVPCLCCQLPWIFGHAGSPQLDPSKIQAVAEWPVPTSRKQLKHFLGFANFYRRLIWD